MTVIAWDGKSICADKRGVSAGLSFPITKIFRTNQGIIGVDGTYDVAIHLLEWFKNGAKPEEYPEVQKNDDRYSHLLLIRNDKKILRYDRQPYPYEVEMPYFATGGGRDYAMASMYCGKTSREAIEIACHFDNGCGNGIDEMFLE